MYLAVSTVIECHIRTWLGEHDSELYYLTLDNSDNSDIKAGI